jgi:rRNA maturation RNase YbeY
MIRFETEDCQLPDISKGSIVDWVAQVAAIHGKKVGEINYLFCSDAKILEYNNLFLNHDYYTDIITFDHSLDNQLAGDIYIGLETVESNAHSLCVDFKTELHRVIIHGVLHLCGYKDKTPEEESIMHEQEDNALSLYF